MLKRKIETLIQKYFKNENGKILVIDGAKQIGKSYIIRYMCEKSFRNYVEINLRDDFDGDRIFENVRTVQSFYLQISAMYGDKINNIDDTIIFLDEIQVYPHLLSLLKALRKDNRYRYIVSGSLLGVTLKQIFIPMGSIDVHQMYPLDFEEFLWANGVGADVVGYLKDCFDYLTPVDENIHKTILNYFKQYLISGGLPDAVVSFVERQNILEVRKIQTDTFNYYKEDAGQYDLNHKLIISRIYDMMPSYMENKVKRIEARRIEEKKYVVMDKYQNEFDYLISNGIALPVTAINEPRFPLKLSMSKNLIKLYYNDVGLLTNYLFKNNINPILNKDFGTNLGSVYETVVAQELRAHGHDLYYFDKRKLGEVDFLIEDYDNLCPLPIEVKSGNDQSNYRAIPKLINNDEYSMQKGYIFGNKNIVKEENKLITLPIYLIMFV